MAAYQSSGAVKSSPCVVYLTLLGQLCDSAPGVPELGGSWPDRGSVHVEAQIGPA